MRDSPLDRTSPDFPLRDSCIRAPLESWLRAAHVSEPDTVILQEVKIPRPSARADMVVVNGEFCGFEIKSDVDNLRRLSRQAAAFNSVFDRVSLVTTRAHLKEARLVIPKWWGIILPSPDATKFTSVRKSLRNPTVNVFSLLHMLVRRELLQIVNIELPNNNFRKAKRADIINALQEALTKKEIRNYTRQIFKRRAEVDSYSSPP